MTGELTNHLWQSTVFAAAVGLLTLAFRKNRAQVRYWVWLSASVKFLIPFSVLIGLGGRLWDLLAAGKIAAETAAPALSQAVVQITQPFSDSSFALVAAHGTNWIAIAALGVWACGFAGVAVMRVRGWLRVRAALRASVPVDIAIPTTMAVRSTAVLLEPGVVGFLRPVLLLPEGILKNLTRPQLEAVLEHEQCHVRRRDNLTSAIHMIVEAVFWFYPVVWWIGARLMEERERACDEAVLSVGSERQAYAEGILNVCQSYLESPLRCVSGVTGADLKKRIRAIMTGSVAGGLSVARKAVLAIAAVAAIAAPIVAGMVGAPWIQTQAQTAAPQGAPGGKIVFAVASIRPALNMHRIDISTSGPRLDAVGENIRGLIQYAYDVKNYQISGGDDFENNFYEIHAEADGGATPTKDQFRRMLQSLLDDRFNLKFHYEKQEMPVYALVMGKDGPKFKESASNATFSGHIGVDGSNQTISLKKATIGQLTESLQGYADRPIVDETGLTGTYDIKLEAAMFRIIGPKEGDINIFGALQEQLGLKLMSQKAMMKVMIVDHVEKPSAN